MSANILESAGNAVKYWFIPLIVGVLLIVAGVWTFSQPADAYNALAMVFSVSFIIIGIMEMYFSYSNRKTIKSWGWSFALGIITLAVGVLLVRDPSISPQILPFYVGFMLMFRSISAIGYSYDLKDYGVMDWGNLLALGILGLLFSFILVWNPEFAGMSVVVWTGLAFLFAGVYSIYIAFKLQKVHHSISSVKNKVNNFTDNVKEGVHSAKESLHKEAKKFREEEDMNQ